MTPRTPPACCGHAGGCLLGRRTARRPSEAAASRPSEAAARRRDVGRGGDGRRAVSARGAPRRQQPHRRRHQAEPHQQPFGGDQIHRVPGTRQALPRVPGYPLTPQCGRNPVPPLHQRPQLPAPRLRRQRPGDHPCGLQLALHPLHPHRGVLHRQLHGGGHLRPGQLARGLQPPQRQQRPVVLVQPSGRLGHLLPLTGKPEPRDRHIHEVGRRIREIHRIVQPAALDRTLLLPPVGAHLVHRHGHQPRAETVPLTQTADALQHPQHGLLHDVIDIGMTVKRPADDVVHQRQIPGDQIVLCPLIPLLRSCDGRSAGYSVHSVHAFQAFQSFPGLHEGVQSEFMAAVQHLGDAETATG